MSIKQNQSHNYTNSLDLIVVNEELLSALETNNTIKDYAQVVLEIISQYFCLDLFLLISLDGDQEAKSSLSYSWIRNQKYKPITKLLSNLISTHYQINNQPISTLEIEKFLSDNKYDFSVIPLNYKEKYLGNLIIKIRDDHQASSYSEKLIAIATNFLVIFIYQHNLEQVKNQKYYGDFLSYMHHEIRTPISSIIGFSKMLKKQLYGELNHKQIQYTNAIYESGKYLLNLVNDLLDISKLEAEKEELVVEKIVIKDLCQSCLSFVEHKAKEQNLKLVLEIDSNINYCYADEQKIKQILINLLSNAVKFTEVGSITLKVSPDKNQINFAVIDTGIGIDEDFHHKLFQPFSQLKTHLHHKHKGTGLGLVIAKELAKLHHGDLTFSSQESKGTCFTLTIPEQIRSAE